MALQLSSRPCARRSGISLAVLSVLGGGEAAAQATADQPLEEVTVTATGTNISGIASVGSEALSIDREEMLSIGANDIADVVRKLPQIQNLGFNEASRGGNSHVIMDFTNEGPTVRADPWKVRLDLAEGLHASRD